MGTTNYCAHAIDDLRRISGNQTPGINLSTIQALIPKIRSSVKFRIPDNGRIFDIKRGETITDIAKYCPVFRLPYPVIALEWAVPDCAAGADYGYEGMRYDAEMVVAYEETVGSNMHVKLMLMYRTMVDDQNTWVPSGYGISICSDTLETRIYPQTDFALSRGPNHPGVIGDTTAPLTTFMQFMAALSCSNSSYVDAEPPSKPLNEKRRRNGKTPFFTYKVLTISGAEDRSTGGRGGSAHGSPRVHLRRGHIRRLPDKTIWVNSCVVGNKSKGMVTKDYALTHNERATA